MNPKLSVILPSLNVESYIEQAVGSVMNQSLREIEIICVDAGSNDGTREKLQSLSEQDSRIIIIDSEKKSYGYQMNIGIRSAKGEYIGIVETDDYIDGDMYEILYNRAISQNADVAKGVLYEVYETKSGEMTEFYIDYIRDSQSGEKILHPDDNPEVHNWDGNIWNGIYKRNFLIHNNIFFNESAGAAFQDIGFQQLVLNEASSVLYIHNHFYHYRKERPGASTWNPKCLGYIYTEYRRLLEEKQIKSNHLKWVYMRMIPAYLYELEKALIYSDFEMAGLDCKEAVDWFFEKVNAAIEGGVLRLDDLDENHKSRFLEFKDNKGSFIKSFREGVESLTSWIGRVDKIKGERKLIVFGAGGYGIQIARFLIRNGILISGFVDNAAWKYDLKHFGLRVMSLDESLRFHPDACYLIANKKSGREMVLQLSEKGIKEDRFLVFDGSDTVLLDGIGSMRILPDRVCF
ncbi:MAG: glycosyltransferase [Lachnospiraceae bacterium]|nr:glycosyltransferase [Lachnospiraceae bacterium]